MLFAALPDGLHIVEFIECLVCLAYPPGGGIDDHITFLEHVFDVALHVDACLLESGFFLDVCDIKRISTPAIDALTRYHWPGNVRELENCVERAVLLCDEQVIHSYHLPLTLQTAEDTGTQQATSLDEAVSRFERDLLIDALKSSRGNIRKAAKGLNTTERIFGYKVKKYNIKPKQYR